MTGTAAIPVPLGERSYSVLIGNGSLDQAGTHLAPFARAGRLVVVSDANVAAVQGARLDAAVQRQGLRAEHIVLEPGEGTKDWPHLIQLLDELVARGVERSDHVIAFGGGVIGDIAGFASAILKRGCGVVQVPTSLLAMVDSSVGGKTGINVRGGKNLVGAFHQPSLVLIDPSCLDSLPERELRAGLAEVIKIGLIADPAFFRWCEEHIHALLSGDPAARSHAIETCVAAKAALVSKDERDVDGLRALLNLGHTFAHALEAESGYAVLHGEAVAVGLALAFRLSESRGLCTGEEAHRVERLLAVAGLPTRPSEAGIHADGVRLAELMRSDKKAQGGVLPLILARGIGRAFVDASVPLDDVARFLDFVPSPGD